MENLLSATERILPLISVAIKLVDGTNVADKSVLTHYEAADGFKVLGDALKGLEEQISQIKAKVGELVNEAKGRGFKKLLQDGDGQKAVEDLRGALEDTFDYLKRLAAGAKDDHSPLTELPCDEGSLVFIQTSLRHSSMSLDNAISWLRSIQSDIKKYRDRVDDAFLRTMRLYNLTSNQQPRTSTSSSAVMTIRNKFFRLLKPRKYRRTGAGGENRGLNGDLNPAITPNTMEAKETSSPCVPTSGLLLQLPPELLILIITVLHDDSLEDPPRRTSPLLALRLTCKALANLCAPVLFRSISLEEADSKRQWRLAGTVQGLGELVHELKFTLKSGSTDGQNFRVYQMLAKMPNIRAVTVVHEREDTASHTAFLTTINQLLQFESLTLQEKNYNSAFNSLPPRHVEVAQTFFHQFLHEVLKSHGRRLKALHLFTLLPLSDGLYIKIRDSTPNLREITIVGGIGVELRSRFSEPILWASGKTGSLESLTLHSCTGVHASGFTQNVIRGAYGHHLKSVGLVACGYSQTDIPSVPTASTPAQATVDCLHLDHMSGWELEALSFIPVQDLSLTRLLPGDVLQLPALLTTGFSGMRKMRLIPRMVSLEAWESVSKEAGGVYKVVQERCLQRGVQLSFDAVAWPNACLAHMHI